MQTEAVAAPAVVVRTRVMREFGVDLPPTARVLLDWAMSRPRPLPSLTFEVPEIPPSINHTYIKKREGWSFTVQTKKFREEVGRSIGGGRVDWRPTGAVMSLIFLESPHWITKRKTMRDMDADNRLKALFDAIKVHCDVPDFMNWEHHCYKVPSARLRTTVYLFDLGDLLEYYP